MFADQHLAGVVFGAIEHVDFIVADDCAWVEGMESLPVNGVLAIGSVKREALLGAMMGALVGRVKGPSCQLDEVGLAAARRAMLRSVAEMRGNLLVRMRLPVSFIVSG